MGEKLQHNRILIVADIEGSSGCWNYRASSFMTRPWARACLEMTRDVDAVTRALFGAGVRQVSIRDFHRTGYNLLQEHLDPRVELVQGYRAGPVPGMGDPGKTRAAMFLGMHPASGSGGFLPHTLTSRIRQLKVNGQLVSEVALFAASLTPFGLRPIFLSGDTIACRQAEAAIRGIQTYPIDKSAGPAAFRPEKWRRGLARAAVTALANHKAEPYTPAGPLQACVVLRDGAAAARRLAKRWNMQSSGAELRIVSPDIHHLYRQLINLFFLTPATERMLRVSLGIAHLYGRLGLCWVRWTLRHIDAAPTPFHPESGR
jgi:D-aminopeptidase